MRGPGLAWSALLLTTILLLTRSAQGEPKIAFSEDLWDFGNITATYQVGHVFKVKNVGDKPLKIEQVATSCGCTATALNKNTIEPGQEVLLGLTFNAATLAPGMTTEKTLTVTSNDPQESSKMISFKAGLSFQGVAGIGIEPKWIQLGKGEGKRTVWKKVILTNQLAAPIEVRILEAAGGVTRAKLTKNRIPSNGRAVLWLLVNGQKLTGGEPVKPPEGHSVTLAFTTERREERVTLPVATPNGSSTTQAPGGDHQRRERN
jgi:hypothetical protein